MAQHTRPSSTPCGSKEPASDRIAFLVGIVDGSFHDPSHDRNSGLHVHPFFNQELYRPWDRQVRARAKLYHPETFATFHSFACPLPTNNSACQNSGDLRALNRQFMATNGERILLVHHARARVSSHQKSAALVCDIDNFSGDG